MIIMHQALGYYIQQSLEMGSIVFPFPSKETENQRC